MQLSHILVVGALLTGTYLLGYVRRMHPRGKLDIPLYDIFFGLVICASCGPSSSGAPSKRLVEERKKLERFWSMSGKDRISNDNGIAFLSVRTAFDLYLKALNLKEGTEVILSAITIPDMVKIVKEHKLVPIPIDMDMKTLEIKIEDYEQAFNENTGLVLIAHIYGSKMQKMDQILEIAHRNGIPVFEDCAEAFTTLDYCGHPESDMSAFSFGTIKTATAFGGCLAKVKDPEMMKKLRKIEAGYENQGSLTFFKKLAKYFFIRIINEPTVYGLVADLCGLVGLNHDQLITAAIRGFAGGDFFAKIRKQTPAPMLALMYRQLSRYNPKTVMRRRDAAVKVIAGLHPSLKIPGISATSHTFWLFPVVVPKPQEFISECRKNGFDATAGATQLKVCPSPEGKKEPNECNSYLDNVIYLPVDKDMPDHDIARMIRIINKVAERCVSK